VLSNITDEESAKSAKEEGAEGVGLFRTEFLFNNKKPTFDAQVSAYEKVFSYFDDVTIRTLDVGGDKNLSYINIPHEKNPFLGIRGVRLFQTDPQIIEEQIHAILSASNGKPIKIMFPMISTTEEFIHAKEFCLLVAEKYTLSTKHVKFGIMVEVPSVLFLIDALNELVDFYSIGTNDLAQYLFAIDRTHETLEIDLLSPVLFQVIETLVKKVNKPLSICGELAAYPEAIPKLITLGIETLSVSPKRIAQTKKEIRNV
jgi:phosphocarrier protein FPr